jgi:hypothetical protein
MVTDFASLDDVFADVDAVGLTARLGTAANRPRLAVDGELNEVAL